MPPKIKKLDEALKLPIEHLNNVSNAREFIRWKLMNAYIDKTLWSSEYDPPLAPDSAKEQLAANPPKEKMIDAILDLISAVERKPQCVPWRRRPAHSPNRDAEAVRRTASKWSARPQQPPPPHPQVPVLRTQIGGDAAREPVGFRFLHHPAASCARLAARGAIEMALPQCMHHRQQEP